MPTPPAPRSPPYATRSPRSWWARTASLSGVMTALLVRGHVLLEGVPGRGQDTAGQGAGRRARPRVHSPGPVHPRPHAVRRDSARSSSSPAGILPLPAGAGVHQPAARRRDQPHPAEDPGRPARGDGGAPGLDRGRAASAAGAVHRDRHPEPRRVRGHLPAARGAAGPLPVQAAGAVPVGRTGDEVHRRRHDQGFDPHDVAGAGVQRGRRCRRPRHAPARSCARSSVEPPVARLHRRPRAGHPRLRRRCRWGCRPAARPRCCTAAKAWAWLAGRELRHPRRGQGRRQAGPAPPHRRCAPRSSSTGPPPTACSTASWPSFRRPAEQIRCPSRCPVWLSSPSPSRSVGLVSPWSLPTTVLVANAIARRARRARRRARTGAGVHRGDPHRCPSVLTVGQRGRLDWLVRHPPRPPAHRVRSPTSWPRRFGPTHRRFRVAVPPGAMPRSGPHCSRAAGARFHIDEIIVRVAGPLGPGGPAGIASRSGTAAGQPAVPFARRGRTAHLQELGSSRSGCGPPEDAAAAPTSTSSASTSPTTSSAASTGPPPHARAGRSCAPTGPSATRRCCCCSTTAGSWPAGSTTCPGSSTPWTR